MILKIKKNKNFSSTGDPNEKMKNMEAGCPHSLRSFAMNGIPPVSRGRS
jgi:hypothetical protein